MANKKRLVDLDLNQNELQNAVEQNLATHPSNPKEGQFYLNTTEKKSYIYVNGEWIDRTSQGRIYSSGTGIDIDGNVISIDENIVARKTDLPTVNEGILTLQVNSDTKQTFNANSAENKTFNVTVPTTAGEVHALPDTTKYAKTLTFSVDSTTYVLTAQLKDQDGTTLSTQTVDLPIESMVLDVDFDEDTNELIITLQSGSVTRVPIGSITGGLQSEITLTNMLDSDLVDDTDNAHKFVTANEKTQISTNATNIGNIQNTLNSFGDIVTHNKDEFTQKITSNNPLLTAVSGVCTWSIPNILENADVSVTVKEVETNEEVIVSVATTINTITIKLNSTADIVANTYKAIIIG